MGAREMASARLCRVEKMSSMAHGGRIVSAGIEKVLLTAEQ